MRCSTYEHCLGDCFSSKRPVIVYLLFFRCEKDATRWQKLARSYCQLRICAMLQCCFVTEDAIKLSLLFFYYFSLFFLITVEFVQVGTQEMRCGWHRFQPSPKEVCSQSAVHRSVPFPGQFNIGTCYSKPSPPRIALFPLQAEEPPFGEVGGFFCSFCFATLRGHPLGTA